MRAMIFRTDEIGGQTRRFAITDDGVVYLNRSQHVDLWTGQPVGDSLVHFGATIPTSTGWERFTPRDHAAMRQQADNVVAYAKQWGMSLEWADIEETAPTVEDRI